MPTDDAPLLAEVRSADDDDHDDARDDARDDDDDHDDHDRRAQKSARGLGEGLHTAVSRTSRVARLVDRRARRVLHLDRLGRFITSSQAVPVAVGLVFGSALRQLVDAFTTALVAPLVASVGGHSHLVSLRFVVHGLAFDYGVFVQAVLETFLTIVALFYLVVVPSSAVKSLRLSPTRPCPECTELDQRKRAEVLPLLLAHGVRGRARGRGREGREGRGLTRRVTTTTTTTTTTACYDKR